MIAMVDSEREMLREKEDSYFGERRPFDSSRQATYEDTIGSRRQRDSEQEFDDRENR